MQLSLGCAVFSSLLRPAGTVLLVPSSLDDGCSHSVFLSPYNLFLTSVEGEGIGAPGGGLSSLLFLCLFSVCQAHWSVLPSWQLLTTPCPAIFPSLLLSTSLPLAFVPLPPISLASSCPLLDPPPSPDHSLVQTASPPEGQFTGSGD